MILGDSFGVGEVLWSLIWLFLFVVWIMLIFRIFADLFHSSDLGGFAKTLWTIFVIIAPFLGVFVYLIARGGGMAERDQRASAQHEAAVRSYIQAAASTPASSAEELERLASLRDRGVIDEAEFARLKAKALG
jgi:ABC-type multidrug transport system fused ATPase/permease subunit